MKTHAVIIPEHLDISAWFKKPAPLEHHFDQSDNCKGPACPICGSSRLSSIAEKHGRESTRGTFFGVFSKAFRCVACGYIE